MKTGTFLSLIIALCFISCPWHLTKAQDPSQTPEKCFCYCCPGRNNPYGANANCNASSPPLVGSVPIAVGAGDLACNAASCNSWFFTKCPTNDQADLNGAASVPRCTGCIRTLLQDTQATNTSAKDALDNKLDRYARFNAAPITAPFLYLFGILFAFLFVR